MANTSITIAFSCTAYISQVMEYLLSSQSHGVYNLTFVYLGKSHYFTKPTFHCPVQNKQLHILSQIN
jgi:hypothetical protein